MAVIVLIMMFKSIAIYCLLAVVSAGKVYRSRTELFKNRIVGGSEAARGEFPHQLSIQTNYSGATRHVCGGAIVSETWVITTAFCVVHIDGDVYVKAGLNNLASPESSSQESRVSKKVIHPSYPPSGTVSPNDIALLKLERALAYNEFVGAVTLPEQNEQIQNLHATLSGWGSIDSYGQIFPNTLQKALLPIIDNNACKLILENILPEPAPVVKSTLCTGPIYPHVSPCNGDYGGPLIQYDINKRAKLIGLASWGIKPCNVYTSATVYTRISSFTNWIKTTMRNN